MCALPHPPTHDHTARERDADFGDTGEIENEA
jgi:hypothetical protein